MKLAYIVAGLLCLGVVVLALLMFFPPTRVLLEMLNIKWSLESVV